MINKKKLLIFIVFIAIFFIIISIFYSITSNKEVTNLSKNQSVFSLFNQKKPLTTYFFSSASLSSPLVAYQLTSISIHETAKFIQNAIDRQFSLIQQTDNSFILDISSLANNSYLEGCNNGDYDYDEELIEPSNEENSLPEIEVNNEDDLSYRSHCAALAPTSFYPIAELETAETVFQEFTSQYSFYPYFILSNFVQTNTGFSAFFSYADDQNYALIYDPNYYPLTLNFDQTMSPTTLLFDGQFSPIKNTGATISLITPALILEELNQKQITPVFTQNYTPSQTDYFNIAHLDLVYYYQNSQFLPYYQMSGKIVDSDNFPTNQVFTFTVPATQ